MHAIPGELTHNYDPARGFLKNVCDLPRPEAGRVLAGIRELSDEYGQETEEGVQIGLKITHQEMANLIGSTRETISLTLATFKKRKLLNMNGRTVVILDHDGLKAVT